MATVLIADDSQMFMMYMKTVLKRMKFHVLTAPNGLKALEMAQANRPDVVLLDIDMPGMSGKEVLRSLKEDPETESLHVVMLTIKGDSLNEEECKRLGCDSYLSKPVDPSLLIKILTQYA